MLHNHQLLMLLRAQQSSARKRTRFLKEVLPTYYSSAIEDLIDRFELELPATEDFFVETPTKASVEPLQPSEELSITKASAILQQSLVGVIKELTEALTKAKKAEETQKVKAIEQMTKIVKETQAKIRKDEEEVIMLMLLS